MTCARRLPVSLILDILSPMSLTILIQNVTLIDGTGQPASATNHSRHPRRQDHLCGEGKAMAGRAR